MKSMRSPAHPCLHRTIGQGGASIRRAAFAVAAMGILSACEQNTFVQPPPAKVDVAVPVQRSFTRYLEATGNTAAIKNVDLVARVQGFLQSINYKDGAFVKEGTSLFTIEPDTYKLKLEQARGRGERRTGVGATGRGGLQAPTGIGPAAGRFPGHAGYFDVDP
ncbi:multidrug efflux pump subunit AcrA (membrane-fusion protein) [Bradyrhizobium sp. URHC0002]